jgi:hypothetical protein
LNLWTISERIRKNLENHPNSWVLGELILSNSLIHQILAGHVTIFLFLLEKTQKKILKQKMRSKHTIKKDVEDEILAKCQIPFWDFPVPNCNIDFSWMQFVETIQTSTRRMPDTISQNNGCASIFTQKNQSAFFLVSFCRVRRAKASLAVPDKRAAIFEFSVFLSESNRGPQSKMLPSKICSTFCWKKSTKLLFREFSTEKKLALSEKQKRNEIGSRKGSVWFGDPEGIKRGFSTSSVCSARGNRVRPAPPSEELGFADYNPVVEDFPDMKHRKPTPKLIERLQNERGDIRELVENSTNFSEAKPANLDEQWSSSPYPASEILKKERDQSKKVLRPKMDPKKTSVVLFPGQGSQFVGMGAKLLNYPNVHEIYGVASEILGYDLLDLCLKGPQENLDRTVFSQTAIYVTSIAALEKLKADYFMVRCFE